ncbi:MAG: homoaconitase [Candidatus Marinimicrobia bacterium]|nr:homoaconitase [Candidatus Neomarinimicrobiota bacterium]
MKQNLIEKIAQRYAVGLEDGQTVQAGDYITISPVHILTHDNTGAVMGKFKSIGATKTANPRQPMFALDHNVQDTSDANKEKYARIEAFAKEMGVDFYPAGTGIGHQMMIDEGYAFPGSMAVASDSHSNMYGGVGCLGTPVVRTDAAAIWATGKTWWQVPPVAKVELTGELLSGVTGKDVIITLAGYFNNDEVLNHALEFTGTGIASLSIEQRLSIANMTTEWGALVGVFPIDNRVIVWLNDRYDRILKRGLFGVPSDSDGNGFHPRINKDTIADLDKNKPVTDTNAYYSKTITLDLSTVSPHVAGPDNVKTMTSVMDMETKGMKINKAYLVSCVNSRVEDLAAAAEVVKGKKVADHVEFYVAAASAEVQKESEKRGDWQTLIDAGAKTMLPGCGQCIGLGTGLLEAGEVGISATNRNFKGRMGSRDAQAYLASPAVVAASALVGKIASPTSFETISTDATIKENIKEKSEGSSVSLMDGFPETVEGELLFCPADNLNTDGIYPGKYTYIDDFTAEQQAEVVMENYDPEFGHIAEKGDILVSGFSFGSGSSREQAATALKYRGIQLVVAGSFSQTYKRNAINNGYLVIEAPELVEDLKRIGNAALTIRTGITATINFKKAEIRTDQKTYSISPVGLAAQELILENGLESWVKNRL